jgi:ligand-binding sensor domain-containing protein
VTAAYALPNPASLINWLSGQDWRAAVEELQTIADGWEQGLMAEIGDPTFVETAVALAQVRTVVETRPGDAPPVVHPAWTSITNANSVTSLTLAPDGTVWAGTTGGLVHWDPAAAIFTKYTSEHGLAGNKVSALALAPDGILWVGTNDGLSQRSLDGSWTIYATQDGLANSSVVSLVLASDGMLWAGTYGGGLSRRSPDRS